MSPALYTWQVELDGLRTHTVHADGFREDGAYTVFWLAGEQAVFAAPTDRVTLITRADDDTDTDTEGCAESDTDESEAAVLNITAEGNVIAERDLRDAIDQRIQHHLRAAWQPYARR